MLSPRMKSSTDIWYDKKLAKQISLIPIQSLSPTRQTIQIRFLFWPIFRYNSVAFYTL